MSDYLSALDIFKIGIGPSSSHTVGPMVAARRFIEFLDGANHLGKTTGLRVELFGSLAMTGLGHGTDRAILLGLLGFEPDTVDPDLIPDIEARVRAGRRIRLAGKWDVAFDPDIDLQFRIGETLPRHANALRFAALFGDDVGAEQVFYSVGGGFVYAENEMVAPDPPQSGVQVPYPFRSAAELVATADANGLSIAELAAANEDNLQSERDWRAELLRVHQAMEACIDRGCRTEGTLPGGLNVTRRARAIFAGLEQCGTVNYRQPHEVMDWVSLYAIAVNEENAAGGRVVTAPTNGAAGIIPAVLRYYLRHCDGARPSDYESFLLTAAAIGLLYKMNASISGAEVGCQGEVGVASSMAAGALAALLGGSNAQVENASEIAMEHHLGMTCDPIKGLVQIPCIERNSMGAIKAINAASLALKSDGRHLVSLDAVIETMRQTGADMMSKYRETAMGGLAMTVQC